MEARSSSASQALNRGAKRMQIACQQSAAPASKERIVSSRSRSKAFGQRSIIVPMLATATAVAFAGSEHGERREASMNPVVELIRNVVYGKGGGRPLRLHILRP